MTWENIGGYSLTTVVIICAGWLVKKWLEHKIKADVDQKYKIELVEFQKKLETEKDAEIAKLNAELNQKTQTAIANLTSELNILEAQNSARFSRVFNKTASAIAEVYGKLLTLKETTDAYTQLMEPGDDVKKDVLEEYNKQSEEFQFYFTRNRIYIPKETAAKVGILARKIHSAVLQYSMAKAAAKDPKRDPNTYGTLFNNFFKLSDEIPHLLEALHDDFQKLLGVAKEVAPQSPSESSIGVVKILYGQTEKKDGKVLDT